MRFTEAYQGCNEGRLTQAEAALPLGQCERSFRRHIERYQTDGMDGLLDKRLSQVSKRRANSQCSGQVISDSLIDFFDVDSRLRAVGDMLPSFECRRMLL